MELEALKSSSAQLEKELGEMRERLVLLHTRLFLSLK
jgi:hypothetical protein